MYRLYRYRYCIGTLDIVFLYIDIISVISEIVIFFQLFNINVKTDSYMNKIEYLIL